MLKFSTREASVAGHGRERGQVLVLFALFLGLAGVAIIGLVTDVAVLEFRSSVADSAAYLAVQAGAGDMSHGAFYAGHLALAGAPGDSCTAHTGGGETGICSTGGRPTAAGACATVAIEDDPGTSVTAKCVQTRQGVTATVRQSVPLPVAVFGASRSVQSTRTATLAVGNNKTVTLP
ncbi:MAG: hypothetical protein ACYCZN_01985 [Candidatus Dormibacteria bacterium]